MISLQEYADSTLLEKYRQTLKTVEEAFETFGWTLDPPWCCGTPVKTETFIGHTYRAECSICGQFMHDVTGPSFGNSYVTIIDFKQIDARTDKRWITGVHEK